VMVVGTTRTIYRSRRTRQRSVVEPIPKTSSTFRDAEFPEAPSTRLASNTVQQADPEPGNARVAEPLRFRKNCRIRRRRGPDPSVGRSRRGLSRQASFISQAHLRTADSKANPSATYAGCTIIAIQSLERRWSCRGGLIPLLDPAPDQFFEKGKTSRSDRLYEARHECARRAVVEARDELYTKVGEKTAGRYGRGRNGAEHPMAAFLGVG